MRILVATLIFSAMSGMASADCGPNGSPAVVVVSDWSVEAGKDSLGLALARTTVEIANATDKAIRMIDGVVIFSDALGGYIANIAIERDLLISASGDAEWAAEYVGTALDRIPALRADEVTVTACVSSVLFDDGTKETF